MSYSSQDDASDQSGFCKLGSDLVISYNGSLLECIPNTRSSLVGTVLTRTGQLVSRTSRRASWEPLSTPSVYLFYDNDTNGTFLVDTCRCKIKEINPCGRILDCTDRVIYEIKCGNWVPICDLSDRQHRTIVLCNSVGATATTATFDFPGVNPVIDAISEIFADQVVFLGNTATVTFRATGPGSLPIGGCAVLAFTVCVDHELVTVFKIFIRQATTSARFSAQGGQIGAITAPIATPITTTVLPGVLDPLAGLLAPTLAFGSTARAFPVAGWFEIYDRPAPGSFDPATGIATIISPGDYLINSQLSYTSPAPIPNFAAIIAGTTAPTATIVLRTAVPYFALLRNGAIVDIAPVTANLLPATLAALGLPATTVGLTEAQALAILTALGITVPVGSTALLVLGAVITAVSALPTGSTFYDLNEIGEAVLTIGLTLNVGDRLQIVFVDPLAVFTGTPGTGIALPTLPAVPAPAPPAPAPGYRLIPLGTTFNATQLL